MQRLGFEAHLAAGGLLLYDLRSSHFQESACPLAAFGHDRDGERGKRQVSSGLLSDGRGCPAAVSVFRGNPGDPTSLLPEVELVRADFRIGELLLAGDRG
jgi:transposase